MKKICIGLLILFTVSLSSEEKKPFLAGNCPVAYVKMGKALLGDKKISSISNDTLYYFVREDAKKMFDKEPLVYTKALQYKGLCAAAVSFGNKVESDPALFTAHEGKLYFFSNADAKSMFDKDKSGFIVKAEKNWPG